MTAGERREPIGSMDVAAYRRAQAKRAAIAELVKKHLGFTNGEIASVSYRAFVDAIYEAGRSSMQEDAQKTVCFGCDKNIPLEYDCHRTPEGGIMACYAAAIRAIGETGEINVMDTQNEAPTDVIGRLPEFACSHWTGYGIESELCQNYLHALSALRAVKRLFVEPSPFFIKKLGSPITNADQEQIDKAFIALDKALEKSEEK